MSEVKQFGIGLDIVIETQESIKTFSDKFIKWIEDNGYMCGGSFFLVDEDGNRISFKKKKDIKG